jgi:hypothetical protein
MGYPQKSVILELNQGSLFGGQIFHAFLGRGHLHGTGAVKQDYRCCGDYHRKNCNYN